MRLACFPPSAALTVALFLMPGISSAAKAEATVVTVAGTPIKKAKIDSLVELMAQAQGPEGGLDAERRLALRKLVATNLVGQELLEREAKALALTAKPAETDSMLRAFRGQFPDETAFRKALRESGDSEAGLRAKIARQIRADKVLAGRVARPEPPAEKEMADFWAAHKGEFPVNDSLRALQIVLLADARTSAEIANQKRRKLEELRLELARDSADVPALIRSFMAAAARWSEGPEGKAGGDLQRFHPGDFNAEFRKQALALRVGRLSPVFRTPLGFHLILLIEKYDGKFESYRLQIMQNIVGQKTMQTGAELRRLLKELAAKYPVKFLVPGYRDSSEAGIY